MNRRRFVRTSTQAAALGGLGLLWTGADGCAGREAASVGAAQTMTEADASPSSSGVQEASSVLSHPGVQLYTLRTLLEDDFPGTLRQVAEIGYDEVEFAGLYERDPADIRTLLDEIGLRAPSGHVPLEAMQNDLDGTIEAAKTLGHEYLVVPYLTEDQRSSLDTYRALADTFNDLGARCQEAGLRFGYHNHDFEFETFGGEEPAYDVLLENTDPDLVSFELDLYWIAKAGRDPLDYFERYAGRFPLFHVKDMAEDGSLADVGSGTIDFARIFAQAEKAGLEHAFVEHDQPEDPLASIRASYARIEELRS